MVRSMVTGPACCAGFTLGEHKYQPVSNLTVLWPNKLPGRLQALLRKDFYYHQAPSMNDDLMRAHHGDDYAIACCVSSMRVGKRCSSCARANLCYACFYAINGGCDGKTGEQTVPARSYTYLIDHALRLT